MHVQIIVRAFGLAYSDGQLLNKRKNGGGDHSPPWLLATSSAGECILLMDQYSNYNNKLKITHNLMTPDAFSIWCRRRWRWCRKWDDVASL
jgi:hypothetical protein